MHDQHNLLKWIVERERLQLCKLINLNLLMLDQHNLGRCIVIYREWRDTKADEPSAPPVSRPMHTAREHSNMLCTRDGGASGGLHCRWGLYSCGGRQAGGPRRPREEHAALVFTGPIQCHHACNIVAFLLIGRLCAHIVRIRHTTVSPHWPDIHTHIKSPMLAFSLTYATATKLKMDVWELRTKWNT